MIREKREKASGGSVASNAEKLAKPALPNTDGINVQCLGQQDLPAADYALFTHACIAECAPCKLLLPFIAYLLPSNNQQQTIHQRGSLVHIPKQGCRSCSTSMQFCCPSSKLEWSAGGMQYPRTKPHPDPVSTKGIQKSKLINFVLPELFRGPGVARLGESKAKLWRPNFAHCTPGHLNLTAPVKSVAWQAC
eukprot:1139613-Pelagomonas_calceolata.AAC.3